MRLLRFDSAGQFSLAADVGHDRLPEYAILSHTWGTEEVTFGDMIDGTGKSKAGYDKIRFCAQQAAIDGLQYCWVDTCCIDKSSSDELHEAINSMFRWYKNAVKCYVYLSDVSTRTPKSSNSLSQHTWESAFQSSRWFTRGWTLQELLAPPLVVFFSQDGDRLGDKKTLERQIFEATGIPLAALRGDPLSEFGIDERLRWAENRQTTREEDKAYSLLGIFDVQMPILYGERKETAFKRLIEEINLKGPDRLPLIPITPCISYNERHLPTPIGRYTWMRRIQEFNLNNADGRHSSSSQIPSFQGQKAWSIQTSSNESTRRTRHRQGRKSRFWRNGVVIAATVVQAFSAAIISQYDASHTGHTRHPFPRSICLPSLTSYCSTFVPLPKAILDPSSAVFANSVMVFGLAVFTSYGIQRDNGSQDHILIFGAVLGFLVSGLVAMIEGDGGAIKDYMPTFITLSLLVSMFGHEMLRRA